MATGMTISRAARGAGVGIETIRFYERRGLIERPVAPRDGGYRIYDKAIVERLRFIRQAQELGFSLREIGELLSLRADPAADCSDIRSQAVAKRVEVDRKIGQLQHIRVALDKLIATCPGGGALRACTIIDALSDRPDGSVGKMSPRRTGRKVKTAIFKIDGMHCEGCARTIEALFSVEPGVRKATVSFGAREARVLFDPQTVSEDRLAMTIHQAGYSLASQADSGRYST